MTIEEIVNKLGLQVLTPGDIKQEVTGGYAADLLSCVMAKAKAGNVWVSSEPEEEILPAVAEILGPDFIMYASDYPHWDGDWPESTAPLRERADLDDDVRAKIAGENARRFYGLG